MCRMQQACVYARFRYHLIFLSLIILASPHCSDVKKSGLDEINIAAVTGACMAFNCHNGTQLRIYPPVSGAHSTHLNADAIGMSLNCGSCHMSYKNIQGGLHKNGFVNGYNWIYGIKTDGEIVSFGAELTGPNPSIAFNHAAGTCSGTGSSCHDTLTPNWYGGSVCRSCHVNPPLSKYPPISGAHEVHRYKNYVCSTCHYRYTIQPTHNDGTVDGYVWQTRTLVAGDIVIFAANAGASAAFSHASGNCTSVGCHVTKNWYGYTNGCSACHLYPPLNQSTPGTGSHTRHIDDGISCLTCHNNYALSDPLHNNGDINGSGADPKATVFGDVVRFSTTGTWDTTTHNCSGLPGGQCHGTENWYSGD